jgi:oligopeptide transport system ATP-binding protein
METGRTEALLEVQGLALSFDSLHGKAGARALRGIDLTVRGSEICGLVGESGSGKTVTSGCIMGLLPTPPARVEAGQILFQGRELLTMGPEERRRVRGRQIAMVFQEPSRYLNPSLKIEGQITEMLRLHLGLDRQAALGRAAELVELVGLRGGKRVLRSYPHELSGGMKQRAMIAMAISCKPALLIADEPTTALDVTLQLQILKLLLRLRDTLDMAVLFISHDLRLVRIVADRVFVIYAGKIVESAPRAALYENPTHPYTRLLMLSIPSASRRGTRLQAIAGRVPDASAIPEGCAFHPRCPLAEEICRREPPPDVAHGDSHTVSCHLVGKKWPS